MALDTYALITVEYLKAYAGWSDDDLLVPGLTIYHDGSVSATAATVEVTDAAIILIITGGANAATYTYTLADAANDTLSEVAGVINTAGKGFVCVAVGRDAATSTNLTPVAAVSCLGTAARQTLYVVDNYLLETLINAASDRIENYLDRRVKTRDFIEYYDGEGEAELVLRNAPVTAITRVAIGRLNAIRIKTTVTDASHATCRVVPTTDTTGSPEKESAATIILTITGGASAGTDTLTLSDVANDTLTELTAVIVATDGWTAELLHTIGDAGARLSSDLVPVEGRFVGSTVGIDLEIPDDAENEYTLNARLGRLMRAGGFEDSWPRGHRNVRVDYTAGWTTVPDDIQSACAELTKNMYDAAQRDSMLESEKIGNYAYKVSSDRPSRPLSPSIVGKLGAYRRNFV